MQNRLQTLSICAGMIALSLSACTPKYPKCDKDSHCKEGEYCVNGLCQQCRDNADCGEGKRCKAGRCEAIEGYCKTNADCPEGSTCENNRCKEGGCTTDEDCPENHECQNGKCVAPPAPVAQDASCTPETVYFDFNEHVLTVEATRTLAQVARCIKSVPGRNVRLEGHCDPRGTQEYNLALGDRRARSVKRYLVRLGVKGSRLRPVSKGKLEATGTNVAGWARDRKVVFIWE